MLPLSDGRLIHVENVFRGSCPIVHIGVKCGVVCISLYGTWLLTMSSFTLVDLGILCSLQIIASYTDACCAPSSRRFHPSTELRLWMMYLALPSTFLHF